MTKEELEKEVRDYLRQQTQLNGGGFVSLNLNNLVLGFAEKLNAQLEAEKKLNEEIKVRFVKCNTCTDEMKSKCLMFSENLCEGDRCEELVDLIDLINKSDLQKENARLKLELEALDGQIPWEDIKDKSEVIGQLTKAIEIIKEYMRFEPTIGTCSFYSEEYEKTKKKAEQFLKEE